MMRVSPSNRCGAESRMRRAGASSVRHIEDTLSVERCVCQGT
jgi:hypothetical protein